MSLVLAALAVAQLISSAQARPAPPATPAPGTASISGTVKNAADDAPLARARVMALLQGAAEPRVAITGTDGKYVLRDLPAGAYTITATRTGFAPYTFGQGLEATGMPVRVAAAQQTTGIDLPLTAGGVIVGRILDEDGAPFAGASVDALITRTQNGNETLFSVATAQTDDRGEFRLFGLAPGSYYVSAADPAFANVSTAKGRPALFAHLFSGHAARRPGAPRHRRRRRRPAARRVQAAARAAGESGGTTAGVRRAPAPERRHPHEPARRRRGADGRPGAAGDLPRRALLLQQRRAGPLSDPRPRADAA
jgi:hypothetical protein